MPFQSEKQRKYLWANEPEIARDWTDKYGSRVKKDNGGITNLFGIPEQHMTNWGDALTAKNKPWTTTPEYHQWGTHDFTKQKSKQLANIPYIGGVASRGFEAAAPFLALGASPIYDAAQAAFYKYPDDPGKYEVNNKWDKINAYFPDLQGTTASGILNAIDMEDPLSAAYNRMIGAGKVGIESKINRQNQIQNLLKKGWGAIKNEFGGSAEAAGIPINNNQSILPKARPRMTANWSQFDDAEAQASGMFKEEDEQSGLWELLKRAGRFITPGGKFNKMGFFPRGGLNFNFNRNRPTPAQQSANQNYMNQQRITRDPQTGRMIGGNFAGLNAPGTSFFGSKTFQEMANKQIAKYGKTAPKAKVDAWKAVVTGGRDPSQGNTHTGHGKSGMGRDPNDRMAQGGLASLWQR